MSTGWESQNVLPSGSGRSTIRCRPNPAPGDATELPADTGEGVGLPAVDVVEVAEQGGGAVFPVAGAGDAQWVGAVR
jgi:hypothetical protein